MARLVRVIGVYVPKTYRGTGRVARLERAADPKDYAAFADAVADVLLAFWPAVLKDPAGFQLYFGFDDKLWEAGDDMPAGWSPDDEKT